MRRLFSRPTQITCASVRSYNSSPLLRAQVTPSPKQQDKALEPKPIPKDLTNEEILKKFDEIFVIPGEEGDKGNERMERLTRQKMRRVPREPQDFTTLEERHVLYGPRGTPDAPVRVESRYPTRIVGCVGSEETQLHDISWHIVKKEKPCVCLDCGQVFQLVLPPGDDPTIPRHPDAEHH